MDYFSAFSAHFFVFAKNFALNADEFFKFFAFFGEMFYVKKARVTDIFSVTLAVLSPLVFDAFDVGAKLFF